MARFLIIRLSSLGDIIHTLPAFSIMRKNFPEANITWIVEDKGKEILGLVPGIDKVVTAQVKQHKIGTKYFWKELGCIKAEIREKNQIALDFQGLIKSGFFAFLSGAQKRIGFHRKNLKEPLASMFYNDHLGEISEDAHVVYKNLRLLEALGIQENALDFPLVIPDELTGSVQQKLHPLGYSDQKKLVVLNVGAAWVTKRWYAERWCELADSILSYKLFPILLWGNDMEKILAEEISQKSGVPLSPDLSLQEVIAIISKAGLVVSGDTFALQAACALSRPVVGIFGPTNPRRNGPFDARDKVAFHEFDCSYCYKRKCGDLKCLKAIKSEEVAELCKQVLEETTE
jgi:lipopolysaccharide heptosyltransferase I